MLDDNEEEEDIDNKNKLIQNESKKCDFYTTPGKDSFEVVQNILELQSSESKDLLFDVVKEKKEQENENTTEKDRNEKNVSF